MTGPKRVDLDAALAEQDANDEPLAVTLFGDEWELPGTIPAAVTIRISDWYENGLVDEDGQPVEGSTLSGAQCMLLLRDMVPPDILAEWLPHLSTSKYAKVVDKLMVAYRDKMEADEAAGKASPPKGANRAVKRASARSSNTGPSSKRTSRASTGSGSPRR